MYAEVKIFNDNEQEIHFIKIEPCFTDIRELNGIVFRETGFKFSVTELIGKEKEVTK